MLTTAPRNSRRAWAALAVAALFTSLAGVAALPASAAEAQAPAITNPIDGTEFHDLPYAPYYIDGTGEPGSTASITDGAGAAVCSAPIDGFGNFSCEGTKLLPAGPNALTVTAMAADGATTVGNTVNVVVVYSIDFHYPEAGSLISTVAGFSGSALPGVEVQMVTDAGVPVCTTQANEVGTYQCLPTEPLPLGPLTLSPAMTVSGSVVVGSPVTWTVIAAPAITSPADGDTVGTMPVFKGTAEPGTEIAIVHGRSGAVLCSAKVAQDGMFTCKVEHPVMVGELLVFPMTSANGVGGVLGAGVTLAIEATEESPAPSAAPTSAAPTAGAPAGPAATAPGTSPAPAATLPAAGPGAGNTQVLAATGAAGIAAPAAVGALMLLGGAAALLPRIRRRARH